MKDERKGLDLYVLQDGTHAAPADCSTGKDGVLRHKNGLAVAMRDNGEPQTVGKDAELHGNVAAAEAGRVAAEAGRVAGEATETSEVKGEKTIDTADGLRPKAR